MATSKVAPPHISSENSCRADARARRRRHASMSWVRRRVASSDWWASRKVVSVTAARLLVEHPVGEPLRARGSSRLSRVPSGCGRPRSSSGGTARGR